MNKVAALDMKKKKPATRTQTVTITRQITLEEKVCPRCGTKFFGRKGKKLCSRACIQKASYDRHAEERRKDRMEKYHAEKKAAKTTAGKK